MAGGTWKILVEQGSVAKPTQSTIVSKQTANPMRQKVYNRSVDGQVKNRTTDNIQKDLAFATFITGFTLNQYFGVTGQAARKNRLNATLTYGGLTASMFLKFAGANPVAGAAIAIGTAAAAGFQFVNFRREVTEQNAIAQYLRQQSNTSISANQGDTYNFSLF